ncbi:MgtC/SapB family protein, partial [Edwardsiella piscicida]|nr:MgtC/SapB family protein [Edwardsiella piscicida]
LPPEEVSALLLTLQQLNLKPERLSLRQRQEETLCEIRLEITLRPRQRVGELYQQLQKLDAVRFLEIR